MIGHEYGQIVQIVRRMQNDLSDLPIGGKHNRERLGGDELG